MKFMKFLNNHPDCFVSALREGTISIDEAIHTIIDSKDRTRDQARIIYEIFINSRKRKYLNYELFSEFLNIDPKHCCEILCNDYVEFEFPVVLKDKAKMARGAAIITEKSFTNVPSVSVYIEKLCKILKKNLSVFFDTDIVEDSFMLSLYIALNSEKYNKPWVFTGGLEEDLTVKLSALIHLKEEICEKSGKTLFNQKDFSSAKEALNFVSQKNYNVPFLVSFSDKRSSEYLDQSFQKLSEKVENCVKRDVFEKISGVPLLYTSGSLERESFSKEVREIHKTMDKIVSNGGVPHISLLCPASLAMGIGAMFGSQNPVVLYHYQGNEYHMVIDLRSNTRIIKKLKDVNSFEKIRFEEVGNGGDCAFVVQFASHSPFADVEEFLRRRNLSTRMIKVSHTDTGGITLGDWSCEVAELMSLFQFIKTKRHFKRFHFFLSVPVPIAFAFGMALGHFVNASIYQYDSKDELSYFEALNLEELQP